MWKICGCQTSCSPQPFLPHHGSSLFLSKICPSKEDQPQLDAPLRSVCPDVTWADSTGTFRSNPILDFPCQFSTLAFKSFMALFTGKYPPLAGSKSLTLNTFSMPRILFSLAWMSSYGDDSSSSSDSEFTSLIILEAALDPAWISSWILSISASVGTAHKLHRLKSYTASRGTNKPNKKRLVLSIVPGIKTILASCSPINLCKYVFFMKLASLDLLEKQSWQPRRCILRQTSRLCVLFPVLWWRSSWEP